MRRKLLAFTFSFVATLASCRTASTATWASVNGQVLDYTLPFIEPFVDARHPQSTAPVVPKPIPAVIVVVGMAGGQEVTTTTDSNGRFVFFGLAGADTTIVLRWPNRSCRQKLHIAAGQVTYAKIGVDYDYHGAIGQSLPACYVEATTAQPADQPAQISGVVAWRESNAPFARRTVTIRSPGNVVREIDTDRRGYFSALGLPVGMTQIWVKDCRAQVELVAGEDVRAVALPYSYNGRGAAPPCDGWRLFVISPLVP